MKTPLAILLSLALCPLALAQTKQPIIIDSPSTRADYQALAERMSMDIRFELEDINVRTIAAKAKEYAKLGLVMKSKDAQLAQLAKETAEVYASLESIHLIFEAKELDLTDIMLELLSKMIAQQQLAEDNKRLLSFQRKAWPIMLPYAKKFAGPAQKLQVLEMNTVGRTGSSSRSFAMKNIGRNQLTACTIVVDTKDAWGQSSQSVYYRDSWPSGESWSIGGLGHTATWIGSQCTLYCNELTAANVEFTNPDFGETEKTIVENYLKAFPKDKLYTGRWKKNVAKNIIQTGSVNFRLRDISDATMLLYGPEIEATVWDPERNPDKKFKVTGRFHPQTDSKTGKLTDLNLILFAGPPTKRIFTFHLENGKLIGSDNLQNQFVLESRK